MEVGNLTLGAHPAPAGAIMAVVPDSTFWTEPGTLGLVVLAYLLGAVPCGLVLTRLIKGIDLRTVGSGNIGATNTMRALGRGWGVVAFLCDFLKGFLPAALASQFVSGPGTEPALQVLGGAAAVLGHCFPVYLGFKGGKGVATGCGAIVAINPVIFLIAGLGWLVCIALTRFVGLSSLVMGALFPLAAWQLGSEPVIILGCLGLTLLIFVRHRSNIGRMLRGEEPRIGKTRVQSSSSHG